MVSILVAGTLLALRVESTYPSSGANLENWRSIAPSPYNPAFISWHNNIKVWPCDLDVKGGELYHDIVFKEGDKISYIREGISEIPERYLSELRDPRTDTIKDLEYVSILIKRKHKDSCIVNIGGRLTASREAFPPPGHMWLWITAILRPTRIIQQGETKKLDERCVSFFNRLLFAERKVQSTSEFAYVEFFLPEVTKEVFLPKMQTYTPHDVAQYLYSCGTIHPSPRVSKDVNVTDKEITPSTKEKEIIPPAEELSPEQHGAIDRAENKARGESFLQK